MVYEGLLWIGEDQGEKLCIRPEMANRHGLIAGATGTGKTVTLKVMAESFSDLGIPVFLADVKGDLAGMCRPGQGSPEEGDGQKESRRQRGQVRRRHHRPGGRQRDRQKCRRKLWKEAGGQSGSQHRERDFRDFVRKIDVTVQGLSERLQIDKRRLEDGRNGH